MDKDGVIFNIQRFCIHDGPGIRTTVFLKGCPLSCVWCHNPESKSKKVQLSFSKELCTNCKICEKECQKNLHLFDENNHSINFGNCIACGKCVQMCPNEALELIGYNILASDVIKTVLKDVDYYKSSGGGITISGGEPLYQADFLLSILKQSKSNGLHTCVETCGFTNEKVLNSIAPYVDLFLYDFKLYDEELHKKYTSVSLKPVMRNLEILEKSSANVILRCPIIPNINDNLEHFKAIALLSSLNCVQSVEILPYHTMGVKKSEKIGQKYIVDADYVSENQLKKWFNDLSKLKCKKLVGFCKN